MERRDDDKVVELQPRHEVAARYPGLEELDFGQLVRKAEREITDKQDAESIADEMTCRKRFGMGFRWNRERREKLIRLKRDHDLTIPQLRWLRYTGSFDLTVEKGGFRLAAKRWIAMLGWMKIVLFGGTFTLYLVAISPQATKSLELGARFVLCMVFVVGFCLLIHATYVWPWKMQRGIEGRR